jgi:DNA-binding MarR family transcriptional regulator
VTYVTITPQALDILDQIDTPLEELHKQTLGHLSLEELSTLSRLLEKARQPVSCSLSPVP